MAAVAPIRLDSHHCPSARVENCYFEYQDPSAVGPEPSQTLDWVSSHRIFKLGRQTNTLDCHQQIRDFPVVMRQF